MSDSPRPVLMLVEDEPLILLDYEDAVRDAGFDFVSTSRPERAIKELEADISRFSAVITDIDLGSRVYGWDIARRARHTDWPVHGVPRSIMLTKPFASAQLVTAIATLLNEVSASAPPG